MKAALMVDWPDLLGFLQETRARWELGAIIDRLVEEARGDVLGSSGRLELLRVYATPGSIGDEQAQRTWHAAGFQIYSHPGNQADVRDRIGGDCFELCFGANVSYIILACGLHSYQHVSRKLREQGARVEVWRAPEGIEGQSESRSVLHMLGVVPADGNSVAAASSGELSGVLRLLRAEVVNRVKNQLRRAARQLSNEKAVDEAIAALREAIAESRFEPTIILAWTDETHHWNGSLTVAKRLASLIQCEVLVSEIREEGEFRRILSFPEIPAGARLLVVDDAAFTGGTLRMLRAACESVVNPGEVSTAVLSALTPICDDVDYAAATHTGKDVLFPWGWARSVDQFYDLLRELGTRDRRWMPRRYQDVTTFTQLTEGEPIIAQLISQAPHTYSEEAPSGSSCIHKIGARSNDHLLYIIRGSVTIAVEDMAGIFAPAEFIYLPRVVPYSIELPPDTDLLCLEFRDAKP